MGMSSFDGSVGALPLFSVRGEKTTFPSEFQTDDFYLVFGRNSFENILIRVLASRMQLGQTKPLKK